MDATNVGFSQKLYHDRKYRIKICKKPKFERDWLNIEGVIEILQGNVCWWANLAYHRTFGIPCKISKFKNL
jgi:hypothetical protein